MRVVDYRRGLLLGLPAQGERTDLQPRPSVDEVIDIPNAAKRRYRLIMESWDRIVYPWLSEHNERKDVYRAPVLTPVVEFSTGRAGQLAGRGASRGPYVSPRDDAPPTVKVRRYQGGTT